MSRFENVNCTGRLSKKCYHGLISENEPQFESYDVDLLIKQVNFVYSRVNAILSRELMKFTNLENSDMQSKILDCMLPSSTGM